MAKAVSATKSTIIKTKKKTSQGNGAFSKTPSNKHSTKKQYRGQGR